MRAKVAVPWEEGEGWIDRQRRDKREGRKRKKERRREKLGG